MKQLADSSGLAGDPRVLAARLAADGYLFFRGLLPRARMRATGAAIAAQLRAGGWFGPDGSPRAGAGGTSVREALADPAFLAAMTSPGFNQIPYLPPLRALVRRILGPGAFSYPSKVLRAVGPEEPGAGRPRGRYIHCDYAVSGVQDMLTTWLPLMDIPPVLGGLAIRPGGHLGPWRPPHLLGAAERHWATAHYHPGDVLLFHCLTPHAALPNNATALRLSGDFRWQRPDRPAPAELILGPGLGRAGTPEGRRPGWDPGRGPGPGPGREMFSRLLANQEWWEPVPAGLTLCPRAWLTARPPGPSQFFAVHPGWQRWRPPPAEAH
jgi:Phytanoyl-CoA dioxygenase (PhyH)